MGTVMTRVSIVAVAAAVVLFFVARARSDGANDTLAASWHRAWDPEQGKAVVISEAATSPASETHVGMIHGRVTMDDGTVYEGRLRWGGDEEALWSNYFNGVKAVNPWAEYVPDVQRRGVEIFGIELGRGRSHASLGRPFMARFGDIARIEPKGREFRVTMRSGTVFLLDRYAADDLADGVRVWDARSGVVDIGEWAIRSIELLPAPEGAGAQPLHGTVRTRGGDFTGLVQWNRKATLGSDELRGRADGENVGLRFGDVRSIARAGESARVTMLDGSEIGLAGARGLPFAGGGIYVDDARYGRVLVSWGAFERLDFHPGAAPPAYGDFTPGRALTGTVVTRSDRRLSGRLVYDLDESETNETLDAPRQGVDYTIPFALIASVDLRGPENGSDRPTSLILRTGERLELERSGDLGEGNGGLLVFVEGVERPEYVPWSEVARIEFARPPSS
jgi:hypothetical protein